RRPGEEGPMLEALAARIEASSCIVSFNGKSFDWPLLRSRFVINRVAAPSVPPHLDLLHCARRLHRGRLESMRLVALERALLDLHREDDVDGSRIPGIYFDFLQGRQGFAEIEGILTHNGDDLIALAALLAHLGRGFAARDAGGDPEDRLAYALVAERFKDGALAARLALAALDAGAGGASRARALLLLARVARRSDAREEEVGHLLELLAGQGEAALAAPPELLMEAELALAKIYEHHLRDYDRAAEHAARAAPLEGVEASARRQARLARRRGVA
ncbi:MAG: ribonuclease H-like domain-containing protein, partial [Myxococcales bacterium]|nr:ribonuclease H-like domain-containing protein [Myxococcales bacterium]